MLVDVKLKGSDSVLNMIAEMNGGVNTHVHLQTGVYLSGHWSFNMEIADEVNEYPEFSPHTAKLLQDLHVSHPKDYDEYVGLSPEVLTELHNSDFDFVDEDDNAVDNSMDAYGVVDSVEQLLSLYDFEADPRKLAISLVSIKRENCSSSGGWRWHKWGTYYGTQKPEYEYLYQDTHIDEVFTFHVYQIL